jgi:hypothetical protein
MDPDSDNECAADPFEYDSGSDLDENKLADFVRPPAASAPSAAATAAAAAPVQEPPKREPEEKPKRTYNRKNGPKEERPVPQKAQPKKGPTVKAVPEVKGKRGAKPGQPRGAVKRKVEAPAAPKKKQRGERREAAKPAEPQPRPEQLAPVVDLGDLRERVRAELMGDFIRYTLKAASDFKTDVVNSISAGARQQQQQQQQQQ